MVVRMRHTRAHSKNRRSHHALMAQNIVVDKASGVPNIRHRVSLETGIYRGRNVLDPVKKIEKKQKRKERNKKKAEAPTEVTSEAAKPSS
jgi:ribosomal protein L32